MKNLRLSWGCVLAVLILALVVSIPFNSIAEAAYPEKPVKMIVAFSPGGGSDTFSRIIAKYAEPYLGQPIVIENKPGAGGQIGFTALAAAESDGYTFGLINIPSILLVKMLRENVPFEMSDFKPIANFQLDPAIIAVKDDSPFKTMKDLIDYAKKNPGKINLGADGPQTNNHLQMVVAEDMLGIEFNLISYNGSGPAIKALLGGEVDVALPSASSSMTHIEEGRMRALCIFLPDTYTYLPDVPTIKEATGVAVPPAGASARGIAVPKDVSDEHAKTLLEAFNKAFNDPKFQAQAKEMGLPLKYMSSEEFVEYLKETEDVVNKYIHLME